MEESCIDKSNIFEIEEESYFLVFDCLFCVRICMYICIYPNDKQCVTSVIIPIYNEIQEREREREKELRKNHRYCCSSLSHKNTFDEEKKRKEKKLLSIVRNEDHCDKNNAIKKIATKPKQEREREKKKKKEMKRKKRKPTV